MAIVIELEPDWRERVYERTDALFLGELGPAIVADERRYAAVRTGHMRDSSQPPRLGGDDGHSLIIENTADYARWVETGHHAGARRDGEADDRTWVPAQPFIRPAVYQERAG